MKEIDFNEDWPIVTVKLTNGENILARQVDFDTEKDVIYLIDVVKMVQTLSNNNGMTVPINLPTLYSPFSVNRIICLSGTDLLFAQDCSDYYKKYYKAVVSELYEVEKNRQEAVERMIDSGEIQDNFTEDEPVDTIVLEGNKTLH